MTTTPTERTWVQRHTAREHCVWGSGVMSNAGLRSLLPFEVCLRAGMEKPDEVAGAWVTQMVRLYIEHHRPDAVELAGQSMRLVSFGQAARVLAGFPSVPWRQHVSQLLGWVDPPAVDPAMGELVLAMLYQVALELAGAVLSFDGRSPSGSPLPTEPATVAVSLQKGQ